MKNVACLLWQKVRTARFRRFEYNARLTEVVFFDLILGKNGTAMNQPLGRYFIRVTSLKTNSEWHNASRLWIASTYLHSAFWVPAKWIVSVFCAGHSDDYRQRIIPSKGIRNVPSLKLSSKMVVVI